MRFETVLKERAKAQPDATALVAGGERLSYAALDRHSDNLAAHLVACGVEPGDRIMVFLDNGLQAPIAIFAALKAGAVFCPVNPSVKADGLIGLVADCTPRVVILHQKHLDWYRQAAGETETPLHPVVVRARAELPADVSDFEQAISEGGTTSALRADEAALAMLIYTSGSTGQPKGVMMSHGNLLAASAAIEAYLDHSAGDVVLSALPLSFTYGLYQLFVSVRSGATLVLEKSFAFPQKFIERAMEERVTGLPLVPTMASILLGMTSLKPGSLPSLRYLTNAAAALPEADIQGLRRMFPQAQLYSMYGLTECARATYLPPEELDRRPQSVGRALPGTEAFILDEAGRPVPAGEVGELVLRGPHITQGYWRNEEATGRALRPAFDGKGKVLHTGDLFRADAEGFLYFESRQDDMFKVRGEKVAPARVDAVLKTIPGIEDAVAFGVPDPVLGQVVHALVVASNPALEARTVIRSCAAALPDVMVPKAVHFTNTLPKTANGKISRKEAAREASRL